MLVLALGLLAAQTISAVLLFRAAEERRETALVSGIAIRLIADDARGAAPADRRVHREAMQRHHEALASPPFGRGMRIRIERSQSSPISTDETRLSRYESALQDVLAAQGFATGEIRVARRPAGSDPFMRRLAEQRPRFARPGWQDRMLLVASAQRANSGGWITVRVPEPRRAPGSLAVIALQTLVIFAVLVALLYLVVRRITRPLALLTERLGVFSRDPASTGLLAATGPADTRRLIAAYNAMETRIAALLDEKTLMLGAIGHDLKTPLAALRVRIESVPDPVQRERMAESIEDITATLDDILILARLGRAQPLREPVDLAALASGVVEEFEDLGEEVTFDGKRLVAPVQTTWLRRALRNLVGNAVRYAGSARVILAASDSEVRITVEDDGPGIPEDRIAAMLEPFTRGEASRNRATGGAGLGLTLARAIAEQHGGKLVLANRAEGGLSATLHLPRG